jgi:hypothetical protein
MSGDFKGRYPGFDVLDKRNTLDWDEQTARVVDARLHHVPDYRFFDAREVELLEAVVDRILPQPDRSPEERVPIARWIDAKLHDDLRDGYRFEPIPPQREAWRLALTGIDNVARAAYGAAFPSLATTQRDDVLGRIQRGEVSGAPWDRVPARRFFAQVLCSTVAKIYYGHPAAWNECGYNGPSSPRGHVRKWIGGVDPWEAHERDTLWDTA